MKPLWVGNTPKIPKKYTHEIKMEGNLEDDRIFGYFDKSSKHYIFDLFEKVKIRSII